MNKLSRESIRRKYVCVCATVRCVAAEDGFCLFVNKYIINDRLVSW